MTHKKHLQCEWRSVVTMLQLTIIVLQLAVRVLWRSFQGLLLWSAGLSMSAGAFRVAKRAAKQHVDALLAVSNLNADVSVVNASILSGCCNCMRQQPIVNINCQVANREFVCAVKCWVLVPCSLHCAQQLCIQPHAALAWCCSAACHFKCCFANCCPGMVQHARYTQANL